MELAVTSLTSKQYTVFTLNLTYDMKEGKKKTRFQFKGWQDATLENCVEKFVDYRHNSVAILTRDVLVIDGDVLKPQEIRDGEIDDGISLLNALITEHGLPERTPRGRTPSGGMHLFFSLTKSLEQGLISAQNRTKITVNDEKRASLDVRGIGGCILVAPSNYVINGETRRYEFEVELCPREDLPAAPSWLIDLLNKDTKRQGVVSAAVVARTRTINPVSRSEPGLFNVIKPVLEHSLQNTIDKVWIKADGFDFSVVDKTLPCVCCDNTHNYNYSNNYKCREVLSPCFTVCNHSDRCQPRLFGLLEHPTIKQILESPKGDDCYVNLLKSKYELEGKQLNASGDDRRSTFYLFDTNIWGELKDIELRQKVRATALELVEKLVAHLAYAKVRAKANDEDTDVVDGQIVSLNKAKQHLQKATNANSICASAKDILWDRAFAQKLDQNRDLFATANGIIDLVTGETILPCSTLLRILCFGVK